MRDRFLAALLESMGVDPALVHRSGVTVAGHEPRAETHLSSGYVVGEHLMISCDPAVEAMLTVATADIAPTLDGWQQVAVESGGELVHRSRMQLLQSDLPARRATPQGLTRRALDRTNSADVALIARLIEVSNDDDLDEADIAADSLAEIIEVLLDADGEIAVYSAARRFDPAPDFADIAILTRADHQGQRLGSVLVAALCQRLREVELEPLYSCSETNTGSIKLSESLGFGIATQLAGYRFPHDR